MCYTLTFEVLMDFARSVELRISKALPLDRVPSSLCNVVAIRWS